MRKKEVPWALTEVRRKLIELLQEDGRISLVEMARRLGMTHVGVRKHLSRLLSSDAIGIKAAVNPSIFRLRAAVVLVEAENEESLNNLVRRFRDCPRIVFLSTLISGFNLIAVIVAENIDVLESVSSVCAIRTAKGVRRSEIMILSKLVYPKYIPLRILSRRERDIAPCGYNCCNCERFENNKCPGCPATKCYNGPL